MTWDWIFRRKPKTPPKPDAAELSELIANYRDALEGFPRAERPAEWMAMQLELGKASVQLGRLQMNDNGAEAMRNFEISANAFDDAVTAAPRGSRTWVLARGCFGSAQMAIKTIATSEARRAEAFRKETGVADDFVDVRTTTGKTGWWRKASEFLETPPDAKILANCRSFLACKPKKSSPSAALKQSPAH